MIDLKSILLIKNLNNKENVNKIKEAFSETRLDYDINLEKQCIIIYGNSDMVAVARNIINDLGFIIL